MFFIGSKVIGFFILPSNLLVCLTCLGLALQVTRYIRLGRVILFLSIVLLATLGLTPLPEMLLSPLEDRFPKWNETGANPAGIIVLCGSIDEVTSQARDSVVIASDAERLTATVRLAVRYPKAKIIVSGGSGRLLYRSEPEAKYALRFFNELGITSDRITAEDRSRNTSESARYVHDLLGAAASKKWLLVTSAYHMPRSMGVFRQEGIRVEAYPVDWRTRGRGRAWVWPDRASSSLQRGDIAVHEWIGLLVYWWTNRSGSLLPAPG